MCSVGGDEKIEALLWKWLARIIGRTTATLRKTRFGTPPLAGQRGGASEQAWASILLPADIVESQSPE